MTYLADINLSIGVLVVSLKESLAQFGEHFGRDGLWFVGRLAGQIVEEKRERGDMESA